MEPGQFQLQIFVSLTVILAAACVALICDFLKGNNEQLRALVIELRARQEQDRKAQTAAPMEAPKVVETPISAKPAATETHATPAPRKRKINAGALAAMERGAALASSGGRPRSAEPVAAVTKPAAPAVKKDWSALLNRTRAAASAGIALPEGFQDGYVLHQLVQSHRPVSGLVVSIGINAGRNADGSRPAAVNELVQSLIGPHDFAAQSAEDEYLLIYPEEQGASAQRRLSHIAQQLWDFQIRALGSIEILFSWGGVEVHSESIDEAIASASERMRETKRGRKLLTMPAQAEAAEQPLRRAV